MSIPITSFRGYYKFLSNFYRCTVTLDGGSYPSVEHAYVAAKTTDLGIRTWISHLPTPGAVKRFGKSIKLRNDWDETTRLNVMESLLRQKFAKGSFLARLLDHTGDCQIVEGNTWGDTFWGVCNGKGQNNLGILLMQIRADNRKELPKC